METVINSKKHLFNNYYISDTTIFDYRTKQEMLKTALSIYTMPPRTTFPKPPFICHERTHCKYHELKKEPSSVTVKSGMYSSSIYIVSVLRSIWKEQIFISFRLFLILQVNTKYYIPLALVFIENSFTPYFLQK